MRGLPPGEDGGGGVGDQDWADAILNGQSVHR